MLRKISACVFSFLFLSNIYGCVAMLTGAVAAGTGTAVWLSGKLTQRINASPERITEAVKSALQAQRLAITTKETTRQGVVQIRSRDADGEKIWVDIHRITAVSSQIEVRVGTVIGNKEAADRLLKKILQNL